MVAIDLVRMIARANPGLKREMRIAHIPGTVESFVKKNLVLSVYFAFGIAAFCFFVFSKMLGTMVIPVIAGGFAAGLVLMLFFFLNTPKGQIKRREREIDREVLYTGRYLLVKMESGTPLFNSLIDASRSFGSSAKYFREIVEEIGTGTTIEQALENAREYNASKKFKKILWQILAALKTGTEVTGSLRSALKAIANEQLIEVKAYGKKLNSLMLFYMVIACIVPSLGVALFIIIASFINLDISPSHLFAILFGLIVVQAMFIVMIKASRPTIEL